MKNYPSAVAALKAAEKRGDKEFKVKFMDKKESAKISKKNSPAIHQGKNPDNGPAEQYAGRYKEAISDLDARANRSKADTLDMSIGGISKSAGNVPVKDSGIKIRGTGAATKGVMARGPMA